MPLVLLTSTVDSTEEPLVELSSSNSCTAVSNLVLCEYDEALAIGSPYRSDTSDMLGKRLPMAEPTAGRSLTTGLLTMVGVSQCDNERL